MHVQIITFRLRDMDEAGYRQLADQVAPAFAEVPGLISKVWLADPQSNSYGGVLSWRGRRAMEEFATSDLFHTVERHPNFVDVSAAAYAVLEAPTKVTRGLGELVRMDRLRAARVTSARKEFGKGRPWPDWR